MKVKKCLMSVLLLFAVSFVNSCEMFDSSNSSEIPISVNAYADRDYDGDKDFVFVNVMNSASIPSVKVNNQSLNRSGLEDDYLMFGGIAYSGYFDFSAGQNLSLEIDYKNQDEEDRTANSSTTIPDSFSITSHPIEDDFEIPWGQDFTITWTQSTGAEAYECYLYIEYETYDSTTDNSDYKTVEITRTVTGTSVTFSANELFPSDFDINEVEYTWGDFDIWACSKKMEEGDMGNVTGDGVGFFIGIAYGGDLDYDVSGSSMAKKSENKSKDAKEKLLKIISSKCQ